MDRIPPFGPFHQETGHDRTLVLSALAALGVSIAAVFGVAVYLARIALQVCS